MPRPLSRDGFTLPALAVAALIATIIVPAALAQDNAEPPLSIPKQPRDAIDADFELDVKQLLNPQYVMTDQMVTDAFWEIKPSPGKVLVLLALKPIAGEKPMRFGSRSVDIGGGRFVTYYLLNSDEQLNLLAAEGPIEGKGKDKLPVNIPRVVKDFTLHPDGKITWELERVIVGGQIKEQTHPFTYKLKPSMLRDAQPQRPVFDPNAPLEEKKQLQAEYMAAVSAYNELRKAVFGLPTEFEAPAPASVLVLFELRSSEDELDLKGAAPLPWTVSLALLRDLQAMTGAAPADTSAEAQAPDREGIVKRAVALLSAEKPHIYDVRLIAATVASGNLIQEMQIGDATFKMVNALLASKDKQTVTDVVGRLSSINSAAARQLMQQAQSEGLLGDSTQLASLRGMLNWGNTEPADLDDRIRFVQQFMADPDGAPARQLLAEMFTAAQNPSQFKVLADVIRFDKATDARLDALIVAVLEAAPTEPLAQQWLDRHLLGGEDRVILRTVELMHRARLADDAAPAVVPQAPSASAAKAAAPVLKARIELPNSQHNIFKVIQSGNEQIRALAWSGMRLMRMAENAPGPDEHVPWARYLFNIAIAELPTPTGAVAFLARHKGGAVDDALGQMVLRAREAASAAATRALFGSGRPVGQVLARMKEPNDRFNFGLRFYENLTGQTHFAIGLIRDQSPNSKVVTWFGQQIAIGRLPNQADWVLPYDSKESSLIQLIRSNDEDMARGAVSALIANVGGGADEVPDIADKLRANRFATIPELTRQWDAMRKEIFAARLKKTGGTYATELRVAAELTAGKPVEWRSTPLGDAALAISGSSVRVGDVIAAIPLDDTLAIRLQPQQFKQLLGKHADDIILDPSIRHVDLKPKDDGSWVASTSLTDGRPVDLVLRKAGK